MAQDVKADTKLKQTWENVWRADDIEAKHLDALSAHPSPNTKLFRPHVERMLALHRDGTLLEAGCGLGQWLFFALERGTKHAIGLDLTADTLRRLRKSETLRSYFDEGRIELLEGDMRAIPLAAESVDLIFSFGVIEHVVSRDSQKTVDEFFRVLRPGGRILLATPNVWSMHSVTRPILQALRKWRVGFERSISPAGLANYCRRSGLQIEESGVLESGY
ncbi:MAG: class I SAM-dependent methyltransferase, partial [Candidatus Eremiobacteraeota bacterium]|nr:class I SAM-dependent methyltransferase [Candidatus Eremiobacteraeota bacterium]